MTSTATISGAGDLYPPVEPFATDDPAPPGPQTLAVARIGQHDVANRAFLGDGELLRDAPGMILHGRYDMFAPSDGAIALSRAWPEARRRLIEDGSRSTAEPAMRTALPDAVGAFAGRPSPGL